MQKKVLWVLCGLFLFQSFEILAETPEAILRSYYLPQFIKDTPKNSQQTWMVDYKNPTVGPLAILMTAEEPEARASLNDLDRRNFLVGSFSSTFPASPLIQNSDLAYHLQVFNVAKEAHLYKILFPTQTLFGEVFGAYTLASGATSDLSEIVKRQSLIRALSDDEDLRKNIREELSKINSVEHHLVDLFHPMGVLSSPRIRYLLQQQKPASVEARSKTEDARLHQLQEYSSWTLAANPGRLPVFLLGQYGTILSLAFGGYSLKAMFAGFLTFAPFTCRGFCRGTFSRLGTLTLAGLETLVFGKVGQNFYQRHNELALINDILHERLDALHNLLKVLSTIDAMKDLPVEMQTHVSHDFLEKIQSIYSAIHGLDDFKGSNLFQVNLVRALIAIERLDRIRPALEHFLIQAGRLDFYAAVAEAVAAKDSKFSYAEFLNSEDPVFEAKSLINPVLLNKMPVANDLSLDREHGKIVILTGPNASGKSTLMRAAGVNVVYLAQTLGLASAERLALTPFHAFHGFMESKDTTGKASSYESDIDRIVSVIKVHRQLQGGQKAFLLVDEILSSTNARGALIGSKIILEDLSGYARGMAMVSTHLYALSELGEEQPEKFHNQHMEILHKTTGPELTYRLVEGKSTESNALDIVNTEFAEFMKVQSHANQ